MQTANRLALMMLLRVVTRPAGKATVQTLAGNNNAFIEEFIVVFTKMIEKVSPVS